jgi:hypothetical protein
LYAPEAFEQTELLDIFVLEPEPFLERSRTRFISASWTLISHYESDADIVLDLIIVHEAVTLLK